MWFKNTVIICGLKIQMEEFYDLSIEYDKIVAINSSLLLLFYDYT